jgi:sugar transferase (PEP-CTERM system associated)
MGQHSPHPAFVSLSPIDQWHDPRHRIVDAHALWTNMLNEIVLDDFRKEILSEPSLYGGLLASPRLAGWGKKRLLILGTGRLADELCHAIASGRNWHGKGFEIVGLLDAKSKQRGERLFASKTIGTFDQLTQVLEQHRVDTIVVCIEDRRSILPTQRLLELKTVGFDVIDGNSMLEEVSGRIAIESLQPSALVFSNGFCRTWISLMIKRLFDVVVSTVGLMVLSPFILLIAALIRLDSPGPILYRQIRVGIYGRPYSMWKFRSMKQDAETSGPQWTQTHDPRISRVGWWLRKARIDEWPQLVNVIMGEMSLVGPRPERPIFVQELRQSIPYYDVRHTVRPGITGWAQVKFRYGNSAEDSQTKLQYDLYYVKNYSIILDMKILVKTIPVVVTGKGAY